MKTVVEKQCNPVVVTGTGKTRTTLLSSVTISSEKGASFPSAIGRGVSQEALTIHFKEGARKGVMSSLLLLYPQIP